MTRGRSGFPTNKIMSPEVGKWVTVNVNGNAHHESRILISPYTMRQFENLLSHLTDKLKPPFGAVWRLFTENGVEVKDLDDIKGGQTYIASGRAKPMFPVSVRAKSGRARREREGLDLEALGPLGLDRDRDSRGRGLRSHSAVGSLGGESADKSDKDGGRRTRVVDSDTNVKHNKLSGPGSPANPRPSRPAPAPRRGKAQVREQAAEHMWDGPLHSLQRTHYQQPFPSTKSKATANKTHQAEDLESDEDMGRMEGVSTKTAMRKNY